MRKFPPVRLASISLAVLSVLTPAGKAQSNTTPLAELKDTATLPEALDWFAQAVFSFTGIGVEDGKTGTMFFKGFKVAHADGCTLSLKNEGRFTQTQVPYLFEATLPIADLTPSGSKLYQHVTDYPNMNQAYGTWVVTFSTEGNKKTARAFTKDSPVGDFKGQLVVFKFQEKEDAKRFEKGFKRLIKLCKGK